MKTLKEKMYYLGLDPKKEYAVIIISNLVLIGAGVALYFFFKEIFYAATCGGVAIIFDLLFLTRYSKQISAKNTKNLMDFATLFGYFRIFIHNGFSVYSALKELTNFANQDFKKSLEELIQEIDQDKSIQPFVKFGRKFNDIIVEEMMISIYQMIDDGENSDYLVQFELIFDKFSDLLYQKNLRIKDSKLGTLGSAPLIGSCFLIIVLTIGIISIIGDLLSGI